MRRRFDAFTLVELLVVVTILAALIAVLMPSLTRAREVSRQVVCASNLRQFSFANLSYAADYRKRNIHERPVTGVTNGWITRLVPYLGTSGSAVATQADLAGYLNNLPGFRCPVANQPGPGPDSNPSHAVLGTATEAWVHPARPTSWGVTGSTCGPRTPPRCPATSARIPGISPTSLK